VTKHAHSISTANSALPLAGCYAKKIYYDERYDSPILSATVNKIREEYRLNFELMPKEASAASAAGEEVPM